jgi:hypothetical protein
MHVCVRSVFAMSAAGLFLAALTSVSFAQQTGSGKVANPVAAVEPLGRQLPDSQSNASPQGSAPQANSATDQHGTAIQRPASISGTVTDVNGGVIPGAAVALAGPEPEDRHMAVATDNGFFEFTDLKLGTSYRVAVSAKGFLSWTSPPIVLQPGQFHFLTDIRLKVAGEASSVTVSSSFVEIAAQQVRIEEQQRIFGMIPNFYVVYDPDAAPLTTKLKFELALRASVDPVSFLGAIALAGVDQAANTPSYVQGAKGYGQRLGSVYADGFTDTMFAGAILPSLLHQDPRYYYQGTGTIGSRTLHALSSPFICKGDNGKLQPNYSSMGGDLASSAFSNIYYPRSDRGVGLTFENFLLGTGEQAVSSLIQEFVLRKFTPKAKNQQ